MSAEKGYWGENRVDWVYIIHVEGNVWCINEYADGSNKGCEFVLSEAPEDLKHWILLGAVAREGEAVIDLPNWDKKEYTSPFHSTWYGYYEVKQISPGKLKAFLPTNLINQIKPIKETK